MPVTQLDSAPTTLILQVNFPSAAPQTIFAYWTEPRLLVRWWPQQAEVDTRQGGAYHLSWPSIHEDLRGHYLTFTPHAELAFTWKWDSDTEGHTERIVRVELAVTDVGTTLTLQHGPYTLTPADQAIRTDHHLAGWLHFLPRLQTAIAANERS